MAAPITVRTWSWRKDFPATVLWSAVMVMAAIGKYHLSIDGAANIFAAMCGLYALSGVILLFAPATTHLQGKPWLVRFATRAILWVLIATTVWFGSWWLFAALVTFLIGESVHRKQAEKRYADQQAA